MNIIKQLKDANGNKVFPLAYAQGGMKMDLLWTNPSPTSVFAAQTVNVDLSGYGLVLICIANDNSTYKDYKSWNIMPCKINASATFMVPEWGKYYSIRKFTVVSNGIDITTGLNNYSGNTANEKAIPIEIYGIKMSYIVPTQVHGLQYIEV